MWGLGFYFEQDDKYRCYSKHLIAGVAQTPTNQQGCLVKAWQQHS